MARVFSSADAKQLGLPGRKVLEIVSGENGAQGVTLRLVEIPVPEAGVTPRAAHQHENCEECIYVLSGQGTTLADSGEYPLKEGDALLMPPREKHVTRNTGSEPLLLLCFFPVADISKQMNERSASSAISRETLPG